MSLLNHDDAIIDTTNLYCANALNTVDFLVFATASRPIYISFTMAVKMAVTYIPKSKSSVFSNNLNNKK